ncbi:MAG: hypothetical protein ACI9SB_001424 [Candidatus Azotimanducaceae bacterium]|jgi:hypothetical protein
MVGDGGSASFTLEFEVLHSGSVWQQDARLFVYTGCYQCAILVSLDASFSCPFFPDAFLSMIFPASFYQTFLNPYLWT